MESKKVSGLHALEIDGLEIANKHAIVDEFGKYFSEARETKLQVGRVRNDSFQKKEFSQNRREGLNFQFELGSNDE